jgi:hypothetical protein
MHCEVGENHVGHTLGTTKYQQSSPLSPSPKEKKKVSLLVTIFWPKSSHDMGMNCKDMMASMCFDEEECTNS